MVGRLVVRAERACQRRCKAHAATADASNRALVPPQKHTHSDNSRDGDSAIGPNCATDVTDERRGRGAAARGGRARGGGGGRGVGVVSYEGVLLRSISPSSVRKTSSKSLQPGKKEEKNPDHGHKSAPSDDDDD